MTDKLSALDVWALARIVYTDTRFDLPTGMSPRAAGLAIQLQSITFSYRQRAASGLLNAPEMNAVSQVDPNEPAPIESSGGRRIIHASELKHQPRIDWIIQGEIPEQGLTVIYGESGVGKSFIGVDYALRVAQTRRVLYVPTEGESGYTKRIEAWCAHHHLSYGECYFMIGDVSLFDKPTFESMLEDVKRLAPAMTVMDTLAMAAAGMDENSARDMGLVLKACRRIITEAQSAVVLVHHTNAGGMIERGSKTLRGNADSMIRVSPADDLIIIECSKTKDEAQFEPRYMALLPVSVVGIGESLVPILADKVIRDDSVLTPNQRKLLDVLSLETSRDGVSWRDLESMTGLSLAQVQRALSNMKRKKLVAKAASGSYALTADGLAAAGVGGESGESDQGGVNEPLADSLNGAIPPSTRQGESAESGESVQNNDLRKKSRVYLPDSADSPDSPRSLFPDLPPAKAPLHYELER